MKTIDKSVEVLNDLIEINNDRMAGFARAAKELGEKDLDLRTLFMELRTDSRENVHELGRTIHKCGGAVEMGMSGRGALHRMWLDLKSTITGNDRKSILRECERGEDAIKKAYETALLQGSGLTAEQVEIVKRQQQQIIASHNHVKALRDAEKSA